MKILTKNNITDNTKNWITFKPMLSDKAISNEKIAFSGK